MATAKRRASRKRIHQIEFLDFSSRNADGPQTVTNQLFNIEESAKIEHQGKQINLSASTLIHNRLLRRGRFFETITLCQVKDHPELQIAVMNLPLFPSDEKSENWTTYADLNTIREIGLGENPHVTKFFAAILDTKFCEMLVCIEAFDIPMDRFVRQMHSMKVIQDLDIFLKRLINHMTDALRFLRTKNVFHRDIRPAKIFIKRDPLCFKLGDFGISEFMRVRHGMANINDDYYIAPEMMFEYVRPEQYRIQSDMWSLGLSMLEITNGVHPFHKMNALFIFNMIKTWQPEFLTPLSPELTDLIESLLKTDPNTRPVTYEEILSSPVMTSLPAEVTEAEQNLVNQVMLNISETDDDDY